MAHTWKYAFGLGLLGAALSAACTVTTGDDTGAGAAGESGSGGTSGKGGSGGTSGKGGSGGTTGGSAGTGGEAGGTETTGGSAGTGGSGEAGMGGDTGGSVGGTSGTGGTDSGEANPMCDPLEGTHAYPDCEPAEGDEEDPCALCVKANCCEESKNCYSTDPDNVCGWGGPAEGEDYAGAGEIGCFTQCLTDYITANEVCDQEGVDDCTTMCTTSMCGIIGDATNELASCMQTNCAGACFGTELSEADQMTLACD